MNIVVTNVRGKAEAFDLGDDRVGAPLDAKPVFIHLRFDREKLEPVRAMIGGAGVARYRRLLGPEIFSTLWAYVDHLLTRACPPPGLRLYRGGAGSARPDRTQPPGRPQEGPMPGMDRRSGRPYR